MFFLDFIKFDIKYTERQVIQFKQQSFSTNYMYFVVCQSDVHAKITYIGNMKEIYFHRK